MTVKSVISKIPGELCLWDSISDAQRTSILSCSKICIFRKGETLLQQGQLSPYVYFVEEGRIASCFTNELGDRSTVRIVGPNNFFSFLFCFRQSPAVFDYVAQTSLIVRRVERTFFEQLIASDKNLLVQVVKVLTQQLEESFLFRQQSVTRSLIYRTAELLVDLSLRLGKTISAGVVLDEFSHQELAQCLGASRPKVTMALRQLAERKLLTLKRCGVLIHNYVELAEFISTYSQTAEVTQKRDSRLANATMEDWVI